jgi:DNA-binding CsgD family transcriptional regulator
MGRAETFAASRHGTARDRGDDPACWLTDQFDAAIDAQEELLRCRRELGELRGEGDALRMLSSGRSRRREPRPPGLPTNARSSSRRPDAALSLALERRAPWLVGELAYWRRLAGVDDQLAHGAAAEPYALSIAGEWSAAAELWRELGCPYEAALALADADDEVALRGAHHELAALGARPAAAIVARRLRERGARGVPRGPRPRTRENPAGLTPRELEVLVLLSEGLRNAQIAQRLVVSEKTVDHHVSAVLRKLDVRTRGEAGAEALRLRLLPRSEQPPAIPR